VVRASSYARRYSYNSSADTDAAVVEGEGGGGNLHTTNSSD
jgi:hypothetical protein